MSNLGNADSKASIGLRYCKGKVQIKGRGGDRIIIKRNKEY